MIRSEQELQTTVQRFYESKLAMAQTRDNLRQMGLSDDVIALALGSLEAIGQQLADEIIAYQRTKNFDFDPVPFAGLGPLLVRLRIAQGLSQAELAARLGTDKGNVSRDEKNEYASITRERIERLLDALDVDLMIQPVQRQARPVLQPQGHAVFASAATVAAVPEQVRAPTEQSFPWASGNVALAAALLPAPDYENTAIWPPAKQDVAPPPSAPRGAEIAAQRKVAA